MRIVNASPLLARDLGGGFRDALELMAETDPELDLPPEAVGFLFQQGYVASMTKPRAPVGLTEVLSAQQQPGRVEPTLPDGGSVMQTPLRRTRKAIAAAVQDQPLSPEQVRIWEKAIAFCVRHLPTLWTAGEPQQQPGSATRWIVPIVLCYPDGFEGKLGEMAWDEQCQEFTVLTDKATLADRARIVASCRPAHGPDTASPEGGA